MPKRRYSTREKVLALSQSYKQETVARMLHVSARTIRRWKNQGVEPARRESERALQESFEREHKRVARAFARDAAKHPGAVRLGRQVRVLPKGSRRVLPVYERGRKTGRLRESEWINYDVAGMNFREVHELLKVLRDDERIVQLIIRIPKGARYWNDAQGRPGRTVKKSTRSGSELTDLSNHEDGDLMDFLLKHADAERGPKSRRILFVGVLDRKQAPRAQAPRAQAPRAQAPRRRRRRK